MPLPGSTETAESTSSREEQINSLLGGDLATTETVDNAAEDTSVADVDTTVEDEPTTQDDTTDADADATSDDDGADADAAGDDETELSFDNLENDFAESEYQRAAAHLAKKGLQVDLNNPGHRAHLKDWLERGQDATRARAELKAAAEASKTESEPEAQVEPAKVKTREEQYQETLTGARAYSKESFNPQVAKDVMLPVAVAFAKFFWGDKAAGFKLEERSVEDLREFTEALDTAMSIKLADYTPALLQAIPQAVTSAFPHLPQAQEMAMKETITTELVTAVDDKGRSQYPGIDKLIENGTIKRIREGELKDAVFSKDPVKNFAAKCRVAYRMAMGQNPNPELVSKAIQRGKNIQKERQRQVGAGKLPPGSSRRGFADTSKTTLKDQLLGGGGSKFSQMLRDSKG